MDKTLKIVFIAFVGFALVLGVIHISQTIKITNNIGDEERELYSQAIQDAQSKVVDTDSDGLFDWEEENIYHTSIYLSDTDSDGISDFDEIEQGTDPNCPEGKVCGSGIIEEFERAQEEIGQAQESKEGEKESQDALVGDFSDDSQEALRAIEKGETPTADQIRALLIDSGISQDQVGVASDGDLIELFEEIMNDQSVQ